MLGSLLLAGCPGQKGPSAVVTKKIKPASGMFTIDGKPPSSYGDGENAHDNIIIKLYPKGRAPVAGEVLSTKVEPDGKFSFSTYAKGDGAPIGEYIITWESLRLIPFSGGILVGPDRFKNNFSNPVGQDESKYSLSVNEQNKDTVAVPSIDVKLAELVDKEPTSFSTPDTAGEASRR
jgi:hypothetical protein